MVVVNPVKGEGDEKSEYEHGDGNLLIVNSSYPTRSTLVSDRVTFALFEKLEEYVKRKGCLKLPNALKLFNHKNKTLKKESCSSVIKIKADVDFVTMAIKLLQEEEKAMNKDDLVESMMSLTIKGKEILPS